MRMAADEEPKFEFYTSRLGIRYNDMIAAVRGAYQGRPEV